MAEFRKRRTLLKELPRLMAGLGVLLALLLVAALAARAALGMYGKFAEAAAARASAESELAELQGRYAAVKAEVDTLSSPRGVEAAVRERYGVVRPGEGEVVIVRASSSTEAQAPKGSLWSRLWGLLFVW